MATENTLLAGRCQHIKLSSGLNHNSKSEHKVNSTGQQHLQQPTHGGELYFATGLTDYTDTNLKTRQWDGFNTASFWLLAII